MEIVCLKCGDIGFSEALVFCNECQAYALHRYCLDGPVILIDDVTWFCEDCEPKPIVPYSLDQSTPLLSETSDSVNVANNGIQACRELKNCIKRLRKSNQQQQKKIEEKQKKGKVNSGLVAKTKVLLSDSHISPQLEHPECSISCEQESESKTDCGSVPGDTANPSVGPKFVQISQVTATGDLKCVELDCHVDAQPISNPIWRGSLHFCDENIGTVSGLLAHLSNVACSKVLEETVLFPEVLCTDLLPRSVVWPKSFKEEGPTDQSIALYFFPENERSEKAFDLLVDDTIFYELAIRVVAKNAELLIFPSTVLPIQHRRFQAKYYLWGVFRGKQTSHKTNDAVCREFADVAKLLTWHDHSPSNTLSNSGSYVSNA